MNGTDVVMGWNQITALGNLPCGQLKKVSKFKHYVRDGSGNMPPDGSYVSVSIYAVGTWK